MCIYIYIYIYIYIRVYIYIYIYIYLFVAPPSLMSNTPGPKFKKKDPGK